MKLRRGSTASPPLRAAGALLLSAALAGAALSAHAGTATVKSGDGQSMTFEYRGDDLLRIGTGDPDGYMLLRDSTLYVVSMNDGQPMVINASSMMQAYSGLVQAAAPSATTAEFVSLKKTGRRETVAGIQGEVYELTVREDGAEQVQEMVMSGDKRAREFRDALFAMASIGEQLLTDEQREDSKDLQRELQGMDMGVLRVGTELTVTAIDGDTVDQSRFDLPAEPIDMGSLGSMFSNMLGGAQGGAPEQGGAAPSLSDRLSGMFGGGEKPKEEQPAENPVGGALKKLFGRGGG